MAVRYPKIVILKCVHWWSCRLVVMYCAFFFKIWILLLNILFITLLCWGFFFLTFWFKKNDSISKSTQQIVGLQQKSVAVHCPHLMFILPKCNMEDLAQTGTGRHWMHDKWAERGPEGSWCKHRATLYKRYTAKTWNGGIDWVVETDGTGRRRSSTAYRQLQKLQKSSSIFDIIGKEFFFQIIFNIWNTCRSVHAATPYWNAVEFFFPKP